MASGGGLVAGEHINGGGPGGTGFVQAAAGVPVDIEKKEAYYLRMHLLITREATALLRARFDLAVPQHQLHATLQNSMKTLNHAKTNKRLDKTQWKLLFPPNGPPSSDTFDITLLVYLLKNICGLKNKSQCWRETDNSKIPDNDVAEEADIARLRNLRNNILHKQVASLEQAEFEDKWGLAEKVMLRLAAALNIPDQKQRIDCLKTRQLDLVTDEMRSIRANTELFLQDYQDNLQYKETGTYQKAISILENKHMVILIGHPREGKTTMAARLALHVSQSPRNCLKIVTPSDWRKIDLSLKLFDTIIIDDIFGGGALDKKLVGDWRNHLNEIKRAADKKAVRVIITSRHDIFGESREEIGSLPMFTDDNEALLMLTAINGKHMETQIRHKSCTFKATSAKTVLVFAAGGLIGGAIGFCVGKNLKSIDETTTPAQTKSTLAGMKVGCSSYRTRAGCISETYLGKSPLSSGSIPEVVVSGILLGLNVGLRAGQLAPAGFAVFSAAAHLFKH